MPICLSCEHCSLQADTAMARLGYGKCDLDTSAGKFRPYDREIQCAKFVRLPADREKGRQEWADRRR